MLKEYDAIVIGLGAAGSAVLYELAKQFKKKEANYKILGIEQFKPPHSQGSSHGETRMFRLVNPSGSEYTQLARRSLELIHELEKESNVKLFQATGHLFMGAEEGLKKLQVPADQNKINYKSLLREEISEKYSQFDKEKIANGYYEEAAGILHLESCIKARLKSSELKGAEIHTEETFLSFKRNADGQIHVTTNKNQYVTKQLILTTGPWMPKMLGRYGKDLSAHRSVFYWFKVEKDSLNHYKLGNFPITMWDMGKGNIILMFPIVDEQESIKVMYFSPDQASISTTPETVNRDVSEEEKQGVYDNYIKPYFKGITHHCLKSSICLFTINPERRFIVDFIPECDEKVIAVSACLRQGFKYTSAIAESIAERVVFQQNKLSLDVFDQFGGTFLKKKEEEKEEPKLQGSSMSFR